MYHLKNTLSVAKQMLSIFILSAIIVACGGGGGNSNQQDNNIVVQKEIGPSGGVLEVTDLSSPIYGAKILVPEGALDGVVDISIADTSQIPDLPEDTNDIGQGVTFGPDGTKFNKNIKIILPYADHDNDGYLDGTDTPEKYLSFMLYAPEYGLWLKRKIIEQDTQNNTITFETNHFTTGITAASIHASDSNLKNVIFTIDGLSHKKILPFLNDISPRESYLKNALFNRIGLDENLFDIFPLENPEPAISSEVEKWVNTLPWLSVVYDYWTDFSEATAFLNYNKNCQDSWSGDPDKTDDLLTHLIETVGYLGNLAKDRGKKFIIVSHSWGTVLTELALRFNQSVEPDLVITLSAPRGAEMVEFDGTSKFFNVSDVIPMPNSKNSLLYPFNELVFIPVSDISDELSSKTVDEMEHIVSAYSAFWVAKSWLKLNEDSYVAFNKPKFKNWINYYATGDVISGPLSDVIDNRIEDRHIGTYSIRDMELTIQYHKVTSLDYLQFENGGMILYANDLRDEVEDEIISVIEQETAVDGFVWFGQYCVNKEDLSKTELISYWNEIDGVAVDDEYVWLTTLEPDPIEGDVESTLYRITKSDLTVRSWGFYSAYSRIVVDKSNICFAELNTEYNIYSTIECFNKNEDLFNQIGTQSTLRHLLDYHNFPDDLLADDQYFWSNNSWRALNADLNMVTRIRKDNGQKEYFDVGIKAYEIAIDEDSLWVADSSSQTLLRIDKNTLSMDTPFVINGIDEGPFGLVVDDTYIWCVSRSDYTQNSVALIARIRKTDYQTTIFQYPDRYEFGRIWLDDHYLWAQPTLGPSCRINKSDLSSNCSLENPINWHVYGDITGYFFDYFYSTSNN